MSKSNGVHIVLNGTATIANVDEIGARLGEALTGSANISVSIEVDEIDLCMLQLLIGAGLQARHNGGTLRLMAPPSGSLARRLEQAGFVAGADGRYAADPLAWH